MVIEGVIPLARKDRNQIDVINKRKRDLDKDNLEKNINKAAI